MKEGCANCRYIWDISVDADGDEIGRCRRYPPVVSPSMHCEYRHAYESTSCAWDFPIIQLSEDCWCGEWSPATAKPPQPLAG